MWSGNGNWDAVWIPWMPVSPVQKIVPRLPTFGGPGVNEALSVRAMIWMLAALAKIGSVSPSAVDRRKHQPWIALMTFSTPRWSIPAGWAAPESDCIAPVPPHWATRTAVPFLIHPVWRRSPQGRQTVGKETTTSGSVRVAREPETGGLRR